MSSEVPRYKDRVTVLSTPSMVLCSPESPIVYVRLLVPASFDLVDNNPMSLMFVDSTWQVGDNIFS